VGCPVQWIPIAQILRRHSHPRSSHGLPEINNTGPTRRTSHRFRRAPLRPMVLWSQGRALLLCIEVPKNPKPRTRSVWRWRVNVIHELSLALLLTDIRARSSGSLLFGHLCIRNGSAKLIGRKACQQISSTRGALCSQAPAIAVCNPTMWSR
jgi:hypothetical protein